MIRSIDLSEIPAVKIFWCVVLVFAVALSGTAKLSAQVTAFGNYALAHNTTGTGNSAFGASALFDNTVGSDNTSVGGHCLMDNTSGVANTASGFDAMASNTTGSDNTASGADALALNDSGSDNTATGIAALYANTAGGNNTASGARALTLNSTGDNNTATGTGALEFNTIGSNNTAIGVIALDTNTTGQENTAIGQGAMLHNTTGNNNIALGYMAGQNLTTESNNIVIGNSGVAGDKGTIRIGKPGSQNAMYIAGVSGAMAIEGDALVVNGSGKLGIVMSSARYKDNIHDMGAKSAGLLQLRPVTFRYKQDPRGERQYGLIAEEVARVYPELVGYGSDGKVQTVRYQELIPMLLNELQKQARKNQKQQEQLYRQANQIQHLTEQSEDQAAYNRRLSAQVARLEGLFEQATAAQRGTGSLAAALNR